MTPVSLVERLRAAPAAMALPVGILALLVLMVLPIPPLLLDIFFVLNIAISVAVAYGVAYFVSAIRGWRRLMQGGWRGYLRQSNLHLAVLTCGIALVLALPVFNFGSISAKNQIARLDSGSPGRDRGGAPTGARDDQGEAQAPAG